MDVVRSRALEHEQLTDVLTSNPSLPFAHEPLPYL